MPKMLYTALLLTITLLGGSSAHAEIHKWVDANGITHYSDKAPKTRKSKTLDYGQKAAKPVRKKRVATKKKAAPKAKRPAPISRKPQRTKRVVKKLPRSRTRKFKSAEITDNTGRRKIVKSTRKPVASAMPAPIAPTKPAFEPQPDLDAEEYDFREATKNVRTQPTLSVKQKLCSEKRMLLAALQEKGFNSYYDEERNYRLAWGADGLYQGKRHYLNEADVAKKTTKVLFEVEQYCDDPHNLALQGDARAQWIRAEYCELSKAVLEDLMHPFMRSTDDAIKNQTEVVEQHCAKLKPGEHRDNDRYYPNALQPKVVMPRHLTLVADEEDPIRVTKATPEETLRQLLSLID